MRQQLRLLTVLIILIFACGNIKAQEYNTGIGARGGFSSGLNFKHFLSAENAVEGIAAFHRGGLLITGLYEYHATAFDVPGLQWYYGGGAHIGIYGSDHPRGWFPDNETHMTLGVDGIVGLDYKIEEIPISISMDVMPRLNIFGHTRLFYGAGFSVRYVW